MALGGLIPLCHAPCLHAAYFHLKGMGPLISHGREPLLGSSCSVMAIGKIYLGNMMKGCGMYRPRCFHTVHLQTVFSVVVIIVLWCIFMYFLWSKQKYFNFHEIKFVT